MKLLRHGNIGAEKPGLLDQNGAIRDLSEHIADFDAQALSPAGLARLSALDPASLPLVPGNVRLASTSSMGGTPLLTHTPSAAAPRYHVRSSSLRDCSSSLSSRFSAYLNVPPYRRPSSAALVPKPRTSDSSNDSTINSCSLCPRISSACGFN